MHAVNLISKAIQNDPESPKVPGVMSEGVCCVTGQTGLTVSRSALFGKSFTNVDVLAAPGSDRAGVDAYVALKYKWERMGSWICDGNTFTRLDRTGVRKWVFTEDMPDKWAGYATTSYKKHGALLAPVNAGNRRVWLFETRIVDCTDMLHVLEWWQVLNSALRDGFGRQILEILDCPQHVMKKCGLGKWLAFERWARPRHKSSLYSFLCYLLPSQKELKDEQNLVSAT